MLSELAETIPFSVTIPRCYEEVYVNCFFPRPARHLGILSLYNGDELFFVVWLTGERRLVLFPTGTIIGDPHHCESPAHRKQGLNLRRSCTIVITATTRRQCFPLTYDLNFFKSRGNRHLLHLGSY